ncbi:DUF4202 domain-containing protein [Hyphomicrobium sp.]|uniref:DUF4202 domain-containing protein n=1 Tax=Hyphomicrobium sp. TaxID=82 RepID=UPI003F7133CC
MTDLEAAYALIDDANARDPNLISADGASVPAELIYGRRMTAMLARVYPNASDDVRLAVRAQHIRRWEVPRASYPMDRPGYLRWRKDLGRKHAEWAGEILHGLGIGADQVARVGALIRKENFRRDAEAQAVEDTAALVFLAHYAEDFAAKHPADKVVSILVKTLAKMSDEGKAAALSLDLSAPVRGALEAARAAGSGP